MLGTFPLMKVTPCSRRDLSRQELVWDLPFYSQFFRCGVSERITSDISLLPSITGLGMAGGGCLWWLLCWGPPSAQSHPSSWWLCTSLRTQSQFQRWVAAQLEASDVGTPAQLECKL